MMSDLRPLLVSAALLLPNAALAQEAEPSSQADDGRTIPATLDANAQAFVEGANAFTLDLLRAVGSTDENLVISPASVSAAMGLAYRGAVGETALQLQKVMRYPFDPIENLKASGALMDTMSFGASGRELRTANSLWLQMGMPFNTQFKADIARYARAGIQETDFKIDPEASRGKINRWVSDATRANIDQLIGEGIITKDTRASLVNAIWLKAEWWSPFTKEGTKTEEFTAVDGVKSQQALMNRHGDFRALKRGGVSAIQLPYKGGELALVAFLPDDHDDLPKFEDKLTPKELSKWFEALDRSTVRKTILTLPKFKLRWSQNLAPIFPKLGAPLPFSDCADFSGIAELPYPGGDPNEVGLKISNVIHEATIKVDEIGAEASAATAVIMEVIVTGTRGPPPPPPFVFRADKPFLFMLRDLRTGLVLFTGRYVRPEPEELVESQL